MQKPRSKKILLFLLIPFSILLAGYFSRYRLVREYQLMRLRSWTCSGDCLQKAWVHRVNSLQRYDLLKKNFTGFETDIVFDNQSRRFWIYHVVAPKKDTLSLDRFLAHVHKDKKNLWLDTRYVDSSHKEQALQALSALDSRYGIRSTAVIELYDLAAASWFAKNGYTVSYFVPDSLQSQLASDSLLRDSITSLLSPVKYVSQDAKYVPVLKKLFPGKKILTWRLPFKDFYKKGYLRQLLEDPQVDIVLVNIKSRYYR